MSRDGGLDLNELESRVLNLVEAEDMQGVADIDEEIRQYLNVDGGSAFQKAALSPEQLQRLSKIYDTLTAHIESVRDGLAVEVRGLKAKQKGIKAYQSSE